jgi:hypothetical protein
MAKVLDEMPQRSPRATRHPWDEWSDGQVRVIARGTDFKSKLEAMRTRLYAVARAKDKKLEIVVNREEETITFQMLPKPTED